MSELIIDDPIVDMTDKIIYCLEGSFRSKEYFGPTVEVYSYHYSKNIVLKFIKKINDDYYYMHNIYQEVNYCHQLFKKDQAEEYIITNNLVYNKENMFYSFLKILESKINSDKKIKDIKKLKILEGYSILLNKNEKCSRANSNRIQTIWGE